MTLIQSLSYIFSHIIWLIEGLEKLVFRIQCWFGDLHRSRPKTDPVLPTRHHLLPVSDPNSPRAGCRPPRADHHPPPAGRRRFLGAVLAGAGLGLAGCLGSDDDAGSDPDDDGGFDEEVFAPHPGDEPTDPPEEHICNGVCGMSPVDWPDWNAQIAHADGTGAFFCSAGCLAAYFVYPDLDGHGGPDEEIVGVWVTDFDTGELIDGEEAHYVLDGDEERFDEPMGVNPRPFADRADAEAFVEEYDDLSEEEIVRLDEFDHDVAVRYRGYAIPDEVRDD